jgi:tetratricopeptide (TPR) repeat protein
MNYSRSHRPQTTVWSEVARLKSTVSPRQFFLLAMFLVCGLWSVTATQTASAQPRGNRPVRVQSELPAPTSFEDARLAIASGRYAEGTAFLEKMARTDSQWIDAQSLLARTFTLLSRYDDAERIARAAVATPAGKHALGALGETLMARGKLLAADSAFTRAVAEQSSDSLIAVLNLALIQQSRGNRDAAQRGFDKFIDAYNSGADRMTSREMAAVATAVREMGPTNPELFKDALKAFDRAISIDPANMDARIALGELFLAKYNGADAQRTLEEVRQINPSHPQGLVATAARLIFDGQGGADSLLNAALEISPEYVPAHLMIAHAALGAERYADAVRQADRALRTNPSNSEALALLAAARMLSGDDKGFEDARSRAFALNPRDAEFFVTMAEAAGRVRRYSLAATFARQAIAADSLHWKARSVLGMNLMRLGQIEDGRIALDASFKGDPYDVWVKNTLDLIDTFKNYETTRSEHALFMVEKSESAVMTVYLKDLAERAHAKFRERYGFAPTPPIRIEVYRSHADFSVRTVGLAGLGALGVSFGTTLAFDSPAAKDAGPFNWASTVWHELAHTFTLGATAHRVPRWLSEGLSVWEEHAASPGWGASVTPGFLDAYRAGKLVPVSRMNDGFMRPAYPEQIGYSYYQASLVCDLIARDFGEKALSALLAEYKVGRTTDEAFRNVLKIDVAAFDKRFDAYMKERFAGPLAALAAPEPEYAAGMSATELANKANELKGSYRAQLLAAVAMGRNGQRDEAINFLERAHALFPEFGQDESPASGLARLYLEKGDTTKAMTMLKVVTLADESAFEPNMELAALALARRDTTTALDALERAVYINPFPAAVHQSLASLAEAKKDYPRLVREREALVALDPVDKAEALYQLAVAYRLSGKTAEAKKTVIRALEDAPNFEKAQELLLAIVDGRAP